jgi:hypothetical protein
MAAVLPREALNPVAGDRSENAVDGGSVGDLLVAVERTHPESRGWMLHGELGEHDTPRIDVLPAVFEGR